MGTVSSAQFIIHYVAFKTAHFSRQPTHHIPSERVKAHPRNAFLWI